MKKSQSKSKAASQKPAHTPSVTRSALSAKGGKGAPAGSQPARPRHAKAAVPTFSKKTLDFLVKAHRQRHPQWLERNRDEYEALILAPLQHLARHLKSSLGSAAAGYHFPTKGIGRLKRPANRVAEGGGLYKNWLTYSASVPSGSMFDGNPNLFFLLNPEDEEGESVLIAGGLYMPSSRQTRAIREALANDATPFDDLFKSKDFSRIFKGGFAREKVSSRPPRGFDPNHPRMDLLKLQAFYVWKPYSLKEFSSPRFAELVERDFRQILRMNALLYSILNGTLKYDAKTLAAATAKAKPSRLADRLIGFEGVERKMDF